MNLQLPERIIKVTECLLKKPCTALFLNNALPCMNAYNYIHYLRVNYGIPVLDKKRDGETLKWYYIPEHLKEKVREWLASFTEQTSQDINKPTKHINKSKENKNDKHS